MAYRMGEMAMLRVSDNAKFKSRLRASIQKHEGVLMHVANDLDVGYTTLKRWVRETGLGAFVKKGRDVARKVRSKR